ncbi:hypothetical protein L202_01414 [Cryptococcus amylolentus CBS 6039]|uniref:DUF2415 domain-containing protein n=1 Tax=Cryptococcus amylolentus CBS 6039 TaxID=1295533 RepID=A0A1E3I3M9_9TREE|nr:hypothetical protein L202_01414 [Cryptococcus amylolentus CBS 6039]ODN83234.1 hypothetical protein L202_01414 [Cryptococcus amylolentus CBS 6039]
MARDPPSRLGSTELEDISLTPSAVKAAGVTIIHPQLRDLILPLEKGRVYYPRGQNVEEMRWSDEDSVSKETNRNGSTRTAFRLDFPAVCLTVGSGLFACGGQHGELFVCEHRQLNPRIPSRLQPSPRFRPFKLSTTLPYSRSINNSIILPPSWPREWARHSREKQLGYLGRGSREWEEFEPRSSILGRAEHGEWIRRRAGQDRGSSSVDDEDDYLTDDQDEEMTEAPSSPVATYPNTLPVRYVSSRPLHPSTSSQDARVKARRRKREEPCLIISNNDCSVKFYSLRSEEDDTASVFGNAPHFGIPSLARHPPQQGYYPQMLTLEDIAVLNSPPIEFPSHLQWDPDIRQIDVEMGADGRPGRALYDVVATERFGRLNDTEEAWPARQLLEQYRDRELARGTSGLPRAAGSSHMSDGGSGGFVSISALLRANVQPGPAAGSDSWLEGGQGVSQQPSRSDAESERLDLPPADAGKGESRWLNLVSEAHFPVAANHSSLSPDLRHMVSVGDSTDVDIFEIDGSRQFRKVATFTAATDAGFSSAWSKDGRKFAVASQDGQVTVWDHRSSRPLAIFHTCAKSDTPTVPSFSNDLGAAYTNSRASSGISEGHGDYQVAAEGGIVLRDPVTGTPRTGSSTSGKEAARVVKFSPEGSSRDLMVFSEEISNIHIIDARTFATHVVLPVPHVPTGTTDYNERNSPRKGVDGGTWGIAGLAFDPTGDWLYSGTEKTVVEWDLRKMNRGGEGTWGLR